MFINHSFYDCQLGREISSNRATVKLGENGITHREESTHACFETWNASQYVAERLFSLVKVFTAVRAKRTELMTDNQVNIFHIELEDAYVALAIELPKAGRSSSEMVSEP
eukprot:g52193.t1